MKKLIYSTVLIMFFLSSCVAVKTYERQFVNDTEMQMTEDAGQSFSSYIFSIREGATPAKGNKGSGGCGCN